jgi:ribulose-phosphate 3-epimerase
VQAADFATAAGAELVLCMSIVPGYSGQAFMPDALERIAELRSLVEIPIEVDGGIGEDNVRLVHAAGASVVVAGSAVFGGDDPVAAYRRIGTSG